MSKEECNRHKSKELIPVCRKCIDEISDENWNEGEKDTLMYCIPKQKVVSVLFAHDNDIEWKLIEDMGVLKEYKELMKEDQENWEKDRLRKLGLKKEVKGAE